ncbi:hypothetical protein [Fluviicola taffensis]|uniref:hypothetical protein n=1 Tax=Fluviicola taffensis TaxID=191579 RepID=UPI0031379EED
MINWKTETINKAHKLISNEYLTENVAFHKIEPAFAKRPLTTLFIEALAYNTPLNIGEAFVAVNFGLLFFCGIALFYLARLILGNTRLSNFSMLFFFLSFTVLFSFFPTNYSYDEPLQYLLIFLSLAALIRKKWALFILGFSLSLIARESTILILPAIVLYFMEFERKTLFHSESIRKILAVILPVVIYAIFLYLFISLSGIGEKSKNDLGGRFSHFLINFQNQEYAVESLLSFALAIGVQAYFLFSYLSNNPLTITEKKLIKAFLLTLIFNTIIVLSTTLAREIRLFALPLVFIWPIFGKVLLQELKILGSAKNYLKLVNNLLSVGTLILLWAFCFLIYRFIYTQTNGIRKNHLDEYLLVVSALISLHFVMKMRLKYDKNNQLSGV